MICVWLGGGPPHTDMFDMKPAAAAEYRGEFMPIKTNVVGLEVCELMPRLASTPASTPVPVPMSKAKLDDELEAGRGAVATRSTYSPRIGANTP